MTAGELNAETLRQLGDNDLVTFTEALKKQGVELLEHLDRIDRGFEQYNIAQGTQLGAVLDDLNTEPEPFLAVACH